MAPCGPRLLADVSYLPAFVTQTIARTFPGCSPPPKHRAGVCVGCKIRTPTILESKSNPVFQSPRNGDFAFPRVIQKTPHFLGFFCRCREVMETFLCRGARPCRPRCRRPTGASLTFWVYALSIFSLALRNNTVQALAHIHDQVPRFNLFSDGDSTNTVSRGLRSKANPCLRKRSRPPCTML